MSAPDRISDDIWNEACRREDVLRRFVERFPDRSPLSAVDEACTSLGVSRATFYRLIERFKAQETVSSLLPRKPGRATGSKNHAPTRDQLIRRTIEQLYLTPERAGFARLVNEIRLNQGRPGSTKLAHTQNKARRIRLTNASAAPP